MKLTFLSEEPPEFSQWGEEFAVAQILSVIPPTKSGASGVTLVEFGASRGPDNSNFWKFREFTRLVLIEADERSFQELSNAAQDLKNVTCVNMRIGTSKGVDDLASALERASIEGQSVAGVSIDIDSDDAAVFEEMGIRPQFAIIEYNPTLPLDGRFRNPKGKLFGNNLGELLFVAKQMEMFPAGLTPTNVIFCSKELIGQIDEIDVEEELAKLDLPRFGWGYDGTLISFTTSGRDNTNEFYHNGWSSTLLFQPLPKYLRGHQDSKTKGLLRLGYSLAFGLLSSNFQAVPYLIKGVRKLKLGKR